MSKTLRFKTYCFEIYKTAKNLNGCQTQQLFEKYGVLSYIYKVYDVLHSMSDSYITDDIDIYINSHSNMR